MPDIAQMAHETVARVPASCWDQAWHSIASWRGYLQSVPGVLAVRVAARRMANDDVSVTVTTVWEHVEMMDEWLDSPWIPRRIFEQLDQPATVLRDEVLEELM